MCLSQSQVEYGMGLSAVVYLLEEEKRELAARPNQGACFPVSCLSRWDLVTADGFCFSRRHFSSVEAVVKGKISVLLDIPLSVAFFSL